jgi:glycosyltransferase involved in cell wall biosynthesis
LDGPAFIEADGVKLIFVNRFFYPDHSATSQLLSDLAFHLAGEPGYDVEVVTSRLRYDDGGDPLPAREMINGVRVRRIWTSRFGRGSLPGRALDYLSFYASAALALLRMAEPGTIVIAKTDPPLISVVAAIVARLRRATLVNWIQDAFPEVARAAGVRVPLPGILRAARNFSLRAAAANVVLGERMAGWVQAQGVPPDRIFIIPNWADGDEIRPLAHAENPRRNGWGVADKFVVAYSGNLGRAHEYGTLLDAAVRLREDVDIVFVFIGGGHHRAALEADVAARRLASFRFLPYQPRAVLRESLAAADVHWISLRPQMEGLIVPSKISGVLAAGRPTLMVGDPEGEIGNLLTRYGCGSTIRIGQDAELAAAIKLLRDAPGLRTASGENARRAFEAGFTSHRAFALWETIFIRLVRELPSAMIAR